MKKLSAQKKSYLFTVLCSLDKKLQYLTDKRLESAGITTRQYLMLQILSSDYYYPPSIKELSERMDTSHQNVKQIAVILEKNGWILLKKDPDDGRMLRLELTESGEHTVKHLRSREGKMIHDIFVDFSDEQINTFFDLIIKFSDRADLMFHKARE